MTNIYHCQYKRDFEDTWIVAIFDGQQYISAKLPMAIQRRVGCERVSGSFAEVAEVFSFDWESTARHHARLSDGYSKKAYATVNVGPGYNEPRKKEKP